MTQFGVGGDFHYDNVRARLMTQLGIYSQTTPRNDASPARGQWTLADAYRYVSEAYGGYHFNVLHGINVDAGIFMSYVGLFSYYNFDNWAYQPSYVSSNMNSGQSNRSPVSNRDACDGTEGRCACGLSVGHFTERVAGLGGLACGSDPLMGK